MKRMILFIIVVILALSFVSCDAPAASETSKVIIDVREIPSHSEVVTEYEYKWSWWHGEFKYVPNTHTVVKPTEYEALYKIYRYDGTSTTIWEPIDEDTYMQYAKKGE